MNGVTVKSISQKCFFAFTRICTIFVETFCIFVAFMSIFGALVNLDTVISNGFIARTTFTRITSSPDIAFTLTSITTVAAIGAFIIFSLTT